MYKIILPVTGIVTAVVINMLCYYTWRNPVFEKSDLIAKIISSSIILIFCTKELIRYAKHK